MQQYQDRNNEYRMVEHMDHCCCKRCQAAMSSCCQTYTCTMSRNSQLQTMRHSLASAMTAVSLYNISMTTYLLQKMLLKFPIVCCHITLHFELSSYFAHNLAVTLTTSTVHTLRSINSRDATNCNISPNACLSFCSNSICLASRTWDTGRFLCPYLCHFGSHNTSF
jgi:hypothetical protein